MKYILSHATARSRALEAVRLAPDGYYVSILEPTRNLEQNAKFHSICGDLEKSGIKWYGKERNLAAWKVLLISGHAIATKHEVEVTVGIEGEIVNIRESSASMSKARSSSLIEYATAFCVEQNVKMEAE